MLKSRSVNDFDFIFELDQGLNNCLGVTENATVPKSKNKENYRPRTLIDETLELIDPTPNIHTLFVQFNGQFFQNVLLPVEVKWSNRMTSCAGTCTFHSRNRQCIITLSSPLLKLRPRKDLVETLLHEMIHGYLFLTSNNRDRDGHGPEFCKHMRRINKEAGTNITIYHDFHEEVKLYKQHWWKCNGPCQSKAPYFGTVRRAMNRAPGPSDFWWKEHQRSCGGEFIKIKEPVKQNIISSQKSGEKVKAPSKDVHSNKKILSWLVKYDSTLTSTIEQSPKPFKKSDILGGKKIEHYKDNINDGQLATKATAGLGKHENYLHSAQGWSTDSSSKTSSQSKQFTSIAPIFSCSGSVGGEKTGRSNLLSKFKKPLLNSVKNDNCQYTEIEIKSHKDHKANLAIEAITEFVKCPKCDTAIGSNNINKHLDNCLISEDKRSDTFQTFSDAVFPGSMLFPCKKEMTKPLASSIPCNSNSTQKRKSSITNQSSKQPKLDLQQSSNVVHCPVCQKDFPFLHINVHLDKCLSEVGTNLNSDKVCSNDWEVKNQVSLRNLPDNDSTDCIIIEGPCTSVPSKTIQNNTHNCLICNTAITSDISLSDHLEECIGTIFNDDSTMLFEGDTLAAKEISVMEKNIYPCPVCMRWLPVTSMNDHLDHCLTDN